MVGGVIVYAVQAGFAKFSVTLAPSDWISPKIPAEISEVLIAPAVIFD